MEARFILPATLAAVFHTFVLFGVTWNHAPKPPAGPIVVIVRPPFPDDTDLPVPKDDESAVVTKGPKGHPDETISTPEPPVGDEHPAFPMPTQDKPADHQKVGDALPVGPIGTLDGDDLSRIASHTFTAKMLDNHPRATAQVPPIYPSDLKR